MSESLRVAVFSQIPPPVHGSTLMTEALLSSLQALGCKWSLVDRRFSSSISDVGKFRLRKVLGAAALLARAAATLKRFRPDIAVYFLTTRPGSFLVDLAVLELVSLFRVPVILYVHTIGFTGLSHRSPAWRRMVARVFRHARAVVTLGESMRQDVQLWVPTASVTVIPNTVELSDAAMVRAAPDRPDMVERKSVLFLSNLLPEKGASTFIEVCEALAPQHPQLRFVVAGAGTDKIHYQQILRRIAESAYAHRFELLGAVDRRAAHELMSQASILLFTSRLREAQPLTIIEAFAYGTPVIAFDTGGVPDLVRDGYNGRLVPLGAISEMANVASALLANPDALRSMGRDARVTFDSRHARERYTEHWGVLVRGVAAEGRNARA